ncbi:hypothetical protein D3C81_868880 [compost metagenome]
MDADRRRLELVQHRDQPAAGDFVADFPPRAPRQAVALQAPFVQHRTVGAFHGAAYLDRHRAPVFREDPAALHVGAGAEGQAVVPLQVFRRAGAAGAGQVVGRGHHHAPGLGQPDRDQAGVGQVAQPDRAVEAFVDQVDHAVGQVQRDRYVRVRFDEQRHQRRHVLAAVAGRRGHAQVAAGLDAAGRDAGLGVVQVVQDALAVFQEGRAFKGQADLARGTYQQLHAQPLFQCIDAAPDDGWRHAFRRCCRRQAAARGDGYKSLQLFEMVHKCSPSSASPRDLCRPGHT